MTRSGRTLQGIFNSISFPTILVFAERRIPITGQVTGALLVDASMGGMSLPWLVGQLFASRGPGVLPAAMMAVLIAAWQSLWWLWDGQRAIRRLRSHHKNCRF